MKHQLRNSAILFIIALVPTILFITSNQFSVIQIINLVVGVAFFCLYLVRRFVFIKTKKQDKLVCLNDGYVKAVEIIAEILVLLMFVISIVELATDLENASTNLIIMSGAYLAVKEFFYNIPYLGEEYLYLATQFPNNYVKLSDIVSVKKLEQTIGNLNPKVVVKYDIILENGKKAELDFNKLSFSKEKEKLLDKQLLKEE